MSPWGQNSDVQHCLFLFLNHVFVYFLGRGSVYGAGSNQEGQLGLGHSDNTTSFHLLQPFCDHAPIKMLSAGGNTSAALTGANSNIKCLR